MTTKHAPLLRSLGLLRRLQRGPVDKETLMEFVTVDVDATAYRDDDSNSSRRTFENDLLRLRELGMDYEYDRKSGEYRFRTFGDFSPFYLTIEELATLAFLAESFHHEAPNSEAVQQLLRRIIDLLPANQQEEVSGRRQRLRMDLRRRSTQTIHPKVQAAIERTIGRQQLRFAYLSPNQRDETPRIHTVQPWEYLFDTARGHYYLDAYRLQVEGPHGLWTESAWQHYRPERILPGTIEVLPQRLPPTPPRRQRHPLEYWLAPEIARLGQITRHFDDMQIHEIDEEGWVRVTATTDNLFLAMRQLLHYGPNCRVTGDRVARQEMTALVEKMGEVYGD